MWQVTTPRGYSAAVLHRIGKVGTLPMPMNGLAYARYHGPDTKLGLIRSRSLLSSLRRAVNGRADHHLFTGPRPFMFNRRRAALEGCGWFPAKETSHAQYSGYRFTDHNSSSFRKSKRPDLNAPSHSLSVYASTLSIESFEIL